MSDKKVEASATSSEVITPAGEQDQSLGKFLIGARERRSVSREAVGQETHIPDYYLRMLESDDYSSISDELYLLPFLRRYAIFLQLDPEETAMRFLREAQRAENTPAIVRMDEPLEMDRHKGQNWGGVAIAVAALIVLIAIVYLVESRRQAGSNSPATSAVSSSPKPAPAPSGTIRTEGAADLPPPAASASPAKPAADASPSSTKASTHSTKKNNKPSAPQKELSE